MPLDLLIWASGDENSHLKTGESPSEVTGGAKYFENRSVSQGTGAVQARRNLYSHRTPVHPHADTRLRDGIHPHRTGDLTNPQVSSPL
jgi:hypothetical protein